MFEILVRTSNWKYSRRLLGIYSAKLTWRSCHGSHKGMTYISTSVGERSVLWFVAVWSWLTEWKGWPSAGLGSMATVVGPPTSLSFPGLLWGLQTWDHINDSPWRSLVIKQITYIRVFYIPSHSLLSVSEPYKKGQGLRGKHQGDWREQNLPIQRVAEEFVKSMLYYSFVFLCLDKIRTVTGTHKGANLGNDTRERRKQVIKSQRDHLCWPLKWGWARHVCWMESISVKMLLSTPDCSVDATCPDQWKSREWNLNDTLDCNERTTLSSLLHLPLFQFWF